MRLQQVVFSILQSAIQNSHDSDVQMTVHLDVANSQLIFIVVDKGQGIPLSNQMNLFKMLATIDKPTFNDELFFNENSQIEMGLIISKQIIQTNGGKLDFYSEVEVGSTIVFTFDIEINLPSQESIRENSPKFGATRQNQGSVHLETPMIEIEETYVQMFNIDEEQGAEIDISMENSNDQRNSISHSNAEEE